MALLAFPIFSKNRKLPPSLPIKASRSPSLLISTKVGFALNPTSGMPKPSEDPAKLALLVLPLFLKKRVLPYLSPMKRSRSLSPSISAKTGLLQDPPLGKLKPIEDPAKAGLLTLPVFWKKRMFPAWLPMKRSRSPSSSISAKTGLARPPTSGKPKPTEGSA